jgi:DNA modification methylase
MTSDLGTQRVGSAVPLSPKTVLERVVALPHTPPYKIHRYFARRPWNVFEKIIETYTSPGDLILDPFMGGGVTVYEGLKLGRKVIGFDLNPLSHFIVTSMVQTDLQIDLLEEYFAKIVTSFTQKVDSVSEKSDQETLWRELTYKIECNYCGTTILLSNEYKVGNGKYQCSNKKCKSKELSDPTIKPKDCRRLGMTYLFSVKKGGTGVTVTVNINPKEQERISNRAVLLAEKLGVKSEFKTRTIIPKNWDRQKEDLLESKGFLHFEDFFTPTNLTLNLGLRKIIKNQDMPENYRRFFRLVFSSSIRDTNVMAFTNDGWQSGKPTTWSRHAYWIPSQFCEVNVLEAFTRAFQRSRSSLAFSIESGLKATIDTKWTQSGDKSAYIINGNLAESEIPENSVDAIITDPPYGSNVQYLELSHFWFPWNKDMYEVRDPNFEQEAVSNRKKNFDGAKTMVDYEKNLNTVFQKSYQVLKPGGVLTLTFNNKDMGAWLALLISIFRSGYTLSPGEIYFQDGVKNYKQTAHTRTDGSPYGDFIYVFRKPLKEVKLKRVPEIQEFIMKMDNIFLDDSDTSNTTTDRYENQRDRFIRSISLIHSISTDLLTRENKESLFKHFDKKYLESFYG